MPSTSKLGTAFGLALCAAGLGLRRVGPGKRTLLLAVGVARLAMAPRAAHGHAEPVTYPPLDVPKPVDDGVWIVDSALPGPLGRVFGIRMTVLRLPSGDLVLHSPTRITAPLLAALDRLGRVRHLVAPNLAHLSFIADWKRAYPEATLWAAPGVATRGKVRRGEVRIDRELHATPPEWGNAVALHLAPGGGGFTEAALFHRPSGTLVLTDLVFNLEATKVPPLLRPLIRLFGSLDPSGMPPPYLRALLKLRRRSLRDAARRLVALEPRRVVFAHGRWFEHDATASLRHALRWLLD